jgi:hypothetical protein
MNSSNKLIGTKCYCGGKFIYATYRKGFMDIVNGKWVQYELKNYPHIACDCCNALLHIDEDHERIYKKMREIGKMNGKSLKYSYIVEYKKVKNLGRNPRTKYQECSS